MQLNTSLNTKSSSHFQLPTKGKPTILNESKSKKYSDPKRGLSTAMTIRELELRKLLWKQVSGKE